MINRYELGYYIARILTWGMEDKVRIDNFYDYLMSRKVEPDKIIDLLADYTIKSVKRMKHEKNVSKILTNIKGGMFFDIGSCFGYYAVLLRSNFDRIYVFEPHPFNVEVIYRILSKQGIYNVEVWKTAIGEKVGGTKLFLSRSTSGHTTKLSNVVRPNEELKMEAKRHIVVEVNTLDNILSFLDKDVDLVKLDVEGAEWDVIKGSEKVMDRINCWMIEHHVWDLDDADLMKLQLDSFMLSYRYKADWLDDRHVLYEKRVY